MYKVKEAADVLGVTRVEIFEIMVSQRELFEPYTSKSNSITYISEDGLSLLRQMLKRDTSADDTMVVEMTEIAEHLDSVPDAGIQSDSGEAVSIEALNSGQDFEAVYEGDYETQSFEDGDVSEIVTSDDSQIKTDPLEAIEASDDLIGQWLKEIQVEDEAADQQDEMLRQMRTQVTQMRNKILSLDSEIRRKDDAIRHYHEIMKDDVRWLEDLERKVQLIVKHGLLEKSEADIESVEEDKNNRFKFFKK